MENLTLNQQQNGTLGSCNKAVVTVHIVLNTILLFFSFPTTFVVIVKLLSRLYKTRSLSSAEIFLLQINFTNTFLFVFNLLRFLDDRFSVHYFSRNLYMAVYSPTLTARPVFLLAICMIFYFAIVHPVTYMTAKPLRHWEWLVITFGWLYALAMNAIIIVYEIDIFQQVFSVLFYNTILPSIIFNIATLRALSSSCRKNGSQTLNPAKRKAFRIILSILVSLLVYYVPRVYFYIHPYIAPTDLKRFLCFEGGVIMFLPKFSEMAMPVIFLYSLRKLSV